MAKGNIFCNDILNLIFNATPIANIAINATTSPLTSLYVGLHTASPGASGDQTTNEATYTSYARVAVVRTSSGWTVSTAQATSPVANIVFPACTVTPGSPETETDFSIGTAATGAGKILILGSITPNITINGAGQQPQLSAATSIVET